MTKVPAKLKKKLLVDLALIIGSIFVAILLVYSGWLDRLFAATAGGTYVASFVAGFFFTSMLTAAPATVVFAKLVQVGPLIPVTLIGAAGAVLGDLILFRFLRDRLAEDVVELFKYRKRGRAKTFFTSYTFRWVMPAIGAIIISFPLLPDELGLALMGAARLSTGLFMPLSYVFNIFGILAVALFVGIT